MLGKAKQVSTGAPKQINKREARVLEYGAKQIAKATYSFASDTGAVATYAFGTLLPANAVVTHVYAEELTTCTSGGSATLTLKAGTTALTAATAFDTGFTGYDSLALASSATAVGIGTAALELKLTIGTAALTAGKVRFTVEYYVSAEQ